MGRDPLYMTIPVIIPTPGETPRTIIRIPAGNYTAVIKARVTRQSSRTNAGVVLVLKPSSIEDPERAFTFSSWGYLRDRLRVFGFATEQELDNADVRLSTKPYKFSSRRWEAPLIEALNLTETDAKEEDLS
jgi:hypothetical protein